MRAIAEGRCVAFLGAGMSRPDAPDWPGLLRQIAQRLPSTSPNAKAAIEILDGKDLHASDYEAAAQILRDAFVDEVSFERVVHDLLGRVVPAKTAERYRLLREIPFEAILTTNLDNLIDGASPSAAVYARLLRGEAREGRRWQFSSSRRPNVIKLHGDANGTALENPVVLARSDYRRRLYQDGRYSNFLRAVFATRTLLFLGVSFTDAYLNELRSEILALAHRDGDEPLGYAVMADRPDGWCAFMRRHDGVEILRYSALGDDDHQGFTEWIRRIHAATAPAPRVASLLHAHSAREGTAARIVWVDRHPDNNRRAEVDALRDGGVDVVQLTAAEDLERAAHGGASLIITSYDRGLDPSLFDRVMDRMRDWTDRPPVIVFTSRIACDAHRAHCLRRGAAECCSGWSRLFDTIERLFE